MNKNTQQHFNRSLLSCALAACLAMSAPTMAQSTGATLRGQVDAVSKVTVTNVDTGYSRSTDASASGSYSLAGLPPGTYRVEGGAGGSRTITLQVAQECCGIRSSWVLFITSLLASYLFLRNPWHRALIVALVIPLGILRNGFRILVLAQLCIHRGPHMIDSDLHHRGGPIFFALSLIPLFLLLWWFRRMEAVGERGDGLRVES